MCAFASGEYPFPRCAFASSARSDCASARSWLRASAGIDADGRSSTFATRLACSRCRLRRSRSMSLPALELAPDRAMQRAVELREPQGLARVPRLRLVVEQPLRDRVAQQMVERDPLQREHLLVDRDVGRRHRRAKLAAVDDVEIADARTTQQLGREAEALRREDLGREHLQRGPLLGRGHRAERCASAAGAIVENRDAADELRRLLDAGARLGEAARQVAAEDRVPLVGRRAASAPCASRARAPAPAGSAHRRAGRRRGRTR